jgi:hypothetical protein
MGGGGGGAPAGLRASRAQIAAGGRQDRVGKEEQHGRSLASRGSKGLAPHGRRVTREGARGRPLPGVSLRRVTVR